MLSVVIPTYNEAALIEQCLQVFQQFRASGQVEVIVADGCSEDDTQLLATSFADQVISSPRGRARQLNTGVACARGEWLLFLHADTLVPLPALSVLLQVCARKQRQWGRFDVRLNNARPIFRLIETMINLRSRLSGIATGDQGIFMDRESFDQIHGFPEIPLMEDIALCKRMKKIMPPLCLRQYVHTSARRWEQAGAWSTIMLMWRLRAAYALGVPPGRLHDIYYSGKNHGA